MFYAKPKMSNHHDAAYFDTVTEAVTFLNEYNKLGPEYEGDGFANSVAKLQAEDFWMLGKLTGPEGVQFKNNKVMKVA
jgi:hypothetical protein